jgi:HK97 family phage portal protein
MLLSDANRCIARRQQHLNFIARLAEAVKKVRTLQKKPLPQVSLASNGQPYASSWSPDTAINEGYKYSSWIYRCIRKRAQAISSIPWIIEERVTASRWVRVEQNHPLEFLLMYPTTDGSITGQDLFEIISMHLDLDGNTVSQIIFVDDLPHEIWPLYPNYVKPVMDRKKFLAGYTFTLDQYSWLPQLLPAEVLHVKYLDPSQMYWGCSPLQAAARVADADNAAVNWNYYSFKNRASVDVVIAPKGKHLTKTQWEELRAQVIEQHTTAANTNVPWVTSGDITIERLSLTPTEMDFLKSRTEYAREICMTFGVPMSLLIGEMKGGALNNNIVPVERAFWTDGIEPDLVNIGAVLNAKLMPYWDDSIIRREMPKFRVRHDLSGVPAMQLTFSQSVKDAVALAGIGFTRNEVNERLKLGFENTPAGDVPLVGVGSPDGTSDASTAGDIDETEADGQGLADLIDLVNQFDDPVFGD